MLLVINRPIFQQYPNLNKRGISFFFLLPVVTGHVQCTCTRYTKYIVPRDFITGWTNARQIVSWYKFLSWYISFLLASIWLLHSILEHPVYKLLCQLSSKVYEQFINRQIIEEVKIIYFSLRQLVGINDKWSWKFNSVIFAKEYRDLNTVPVNSINK